MPSTHPGSSWCTVHLLDVGVDLILMYMRRGADKFYARRPRKKKAPSIYLSVFLHFYGLHNTK